MHTFARLHIVSILHAVLWVITFNRIYNRLSIVSNPEMSSRMWEYSVGHIQYMPFHISEFIIMGFGLHMGFKSPSLADTEG